MAKTYEQRVKKSSFVLGNINSFRYKSSMNLGVAGETIQLPIVTLVLITIAPIVLFFGAVKIKSELNKRKAKKV